jgi:hypothetical protein
MTIKRRPREVSVANKYDIVFNFRTTSEHINQMKKHSKDNGISVSDLIRLAVDKEMGKRPIDKLLVR